MQTPPQTLPDIPEAILFDVFGTVFDWRTTITDGLQQAISKKLDTTGDVKDSTTEPTVDISDSRKLNAFCQNLAQEWRNSYMNFVVSGSKKNATENKSTAVEPDITTAEATYKTIDEYHLSSLCSLLDKYKLKHLFTSSELFEISRLWHRLQAWPDSKQGIELLRELTVVSTLSNGNIRLLVDLSKNSNVRFDTLLSAQLWRSYKPEPKVYIGACEVLGVADDEKWEEYVKEGGQGDKEEWKQRERGKAALAAAHIGDLKAAKNCGLKTIYIRRPYEDASNDLFEDYLKSNENWIDMYVNADEGGIVEVASRLKETKARK